MRRFFLATAMFVAVLTGCSKDDGGQSLYKETKIEGLIKLSVLVDTSKPIYYQGQTKAFGADHIDGSYDKIISTLDVFVFDKSTGALDGFKSFKGDELTSLSDLEIKSKVGLKNIYAVANVASSLWQGVTSETKFLEVQSNLKDEDYKRFIMSGYAESNISNSTTVSIEISRLVCRIVVKDIKVDFSSTPYSGMKLENVKVYLTNVNGNIKVAGGQLPNQILKLNALGYKSEDCSNSKIIDLLCNQLGDISSSGITQPYYFYTYENLLSDETPNDKYTRLVVQGDLDGKTYYYPININRENYGWSDNIDHKGIKRNSSYTYSITITRPGSLTPEDMVDFAALSLNLIVDDWKVIPESIIEF